jgi:FlaA1/EpsC-like NDP-sugar epimerase
VMVQDKLLEGKRLLVTGGTGSLGKVLIRRLLSGEMGRPAKILVFSRDEAKQHEMRMAYRNMAAATDEIIYRNSQELLEFRIGDVRDYHSVAGALNQSEFVFNAAALKQVPTCEYSPFEAVQTNIVGPENIVRAIQEQATPVETVIGISTDKACKPVNVMGMTKAIQERLFIQANLRCPDVRFITVRYGNVLASRGSVIPLFVEQIRQGGPVTITTPEMTRFLLSLDKAVDTIFAAIGEARRGETYVPKVPSALITDLASTLINGRPVEVRFTGIRPGEKVHEILVSEEETHRTVERNGYLAIMPILPELRLADTGMRTVTAEFSSADHVLDRQELRTLLTEHGLMDEQPATEELLR